MGTRSVPIVHDRVRELVGGDAPLSPHVLEACAPLLEHPDHAAQHPDRRLRPTHAAPAGGSRPEHARSRETGAGAG